MSGAIPNEYTPCEEYRGFTITTAGPWYAAFRDGERFRDPNGIAYRRDLRSQMRRSIDAWLDEGKVA